MFSITLFQLWLRKVVFPAYCFPALDYTCKQVSELCAQCHRLFADHGLKENKSQLVLEERLNKDIVVFTISSSREVNFHESIMKQLNLKSNDKLKVEEIGLFDRKPISLMISHHSNNAISALFLLADDTNIGEKDLEEIFNKKTDTNIESRLNVILVGNKARSHSRAEPRIVSGLLIHESSPEYTFDLVDDLGDKFVFSVVEKKAEALLGIKEWFYREPRSQYLSIEDYGLTWTEDNVKKQSSKGIVMFSI